MAVVVPAYPMQYKVIVPLGKACAYLLFTLMDINVALLAAINTRPRYRTGPHFPALSGGLARRAPLLQENNWKIDGGPLVD